MPTKEENTIGLQGIEMRWGGKSFGSFTYGEFGSDKMELALKGMVDNFLDGHFELSTVLITQLFKAASREDVGSIVRLDTSNCLDGNARVTKSRRAKETTIFQIIRYEDEGRLEQIDHFLPAGMVKGIYG